MEIIYSNSDFTGLKFRFIGLSSVQWRTNMNINQFMPTEDVPLDLQSISTMVADRIDTYRGFALIESNRGVLAPQVSLDSSRGQEILRILMFRVIEECCESYLAEDRPHVLEEAIDAINYLWSMLIVDPQRYTPEHVAQGLLDVFQDPTVARIAIPHPKGSPLKPHDIGDVALWLAGDIGDMLRNRAWMNNSQDIYFQGTDRLELAVHRVTALLYSMFDSWEEFSRFYIAKDRVLKFRLRSNY